MHFKQKENIMKRFSRILIIFLLASGTLYAQQMTGDRVRQNMVRLQRKLVQVSALVQKYHDMRAIKLVDKAKSELVLADNKYKEYKNTPERQMSKRKLLINLAGAHFNLAEKYIGAASKFLMFKPAAQKKNELNNLISKAENVVNRSQSDESRYFLNKARRFQSEAQSAFRNERFLQGYEFLRVALYFAQKTIDMSSIPGRGHSDKQDFNNALENTRVLLQRAGELISGNNLSDQMYRRAEDYFQKAERAYRSDHLKQAFSQLKFAERLLYRVVDMSGNSSATAEQQTQDNLQSLGRYLQSLQSDFQGTANPFLDKAYKLYRRAVRQAQDKKHRQAQVSIQLSQRMALKAYRQKTNSSVDDDEEQLKSRYNDARHLYDLQDVSMTEATPSLQTIHLQAGKYLNQAGEALQNNRLVQAHYLLKISLKLMNRARQSKFHDATQPQVENNIKRLSDALKRLQNNTTLGEVWQVRVSTLSDLLQQAQNALEKGDVSVAANLAGFIQNQLTALLKRN